MELEANYKTDGLASAAEEHVRAIILGSQQVVPFTLTRGVNLSVQHPASPMKLHTFHRRDNGNGRYKRKRPAVYSRTRWNSAKDNGSPINGLPLPSSSHSEPIIAALRWSGWLFHKRKIVGRWLVCPLPLLSLKHLCLSCEVVAQGEPLVPGLPASGVSAGVLRCSAHQRKHANQITDLSSLVDVQSLEVLLRPSYRA